MDKNRNSRVSTFDEDIDPGDPIGELAEFQVTPSSGFLDQLFRNIDRHLLGVQLLDSVRFCMREFFIEYWQIAVCILTGKKKN